MNYQFRPAIKSSAKLLLGIYSESGRGKTYSSCLVARGFVGPNGTVGMVETESGRGEIYVDVIPEGYQVYPLSGNFAPSEYGKAITAAEQAQFGALIIDSASHEWESTGGVLDMAADNLAAGKKGVLVWQKPKMEHAKHFVLRLMASPIPLIIVNMRAKYPMTEVVQNGKKEWSRSDQLEPKQSDDILYEMLIHGWIDSEHRYHVTKYPKAIPELRDVVRDGEPLSIETGRRLAQWAAGRGSAPAQSQQTTKPAAGSPAVITEEQVLALIARCDEHGISTQALKAAAKVSDLGALAADDLPKANTWIDAAIAKRKSAQQPA